MYKTKHEVVWLPPKSFVIKKGVMLHLNPKVSFHIKENEFVLFLLHSIAWEKNISLRMVSSGPTF